MTPRPLAVCIEQTLGHRTHGMNLERALTARAANADVIHVEYPSGPVACVPWALQGSWQAYRKIRSSGTPYGVAFFHTQTVGLFAPRLHHPTRYVISVDATPAQMDTMGSWYQHHRQSRLLELPKARWYRHVLQHASAVVAWSAWARDSLVEDYGVSEDLVTVAHPGAPDELFAIEHRVAPNGRPRILFVGGDFERKGGHHLIEAFRPLRDRAELVLVTDADIEPGAGITVLRGVRPGTPAFVDAWSRADIFCLPTLGDCTPVAIGEAMAAGLPVVTTTVGSNPETVGKDTGLLIPPGDVEALASALRCLVDDTAKRATLAAGARSHARKHLSARANADRVVDLLEDLAR